jgi:uncharacterized protein (TIGR02996 family)
LISINSIALRHPIGQDNPMGVPLPEPMEAALAATPDAPAAYLVAADWLQARGDPRGELISLMFDLEHEQSPGRFLALKRRREELLALHEDAWVGGAHLDSTIWRWGHVHQARLQVEHLGALLASPAGRLVRELEVHGPLGELAQVLAARPPVLLDGLGLVGTRRDLPVPLAPVLAALPRLTRLGVFEADVDLGGLDATGLVDLRLRDVHHPSVTPFLARLAAPRVTHLELSLEAPLELKTEAASRMQGLSVLRIEDDLADDLAAWAAVAPRTSRLARLAVCGPMTETGLDALLMASARLQGVSLSLEGGSFGGTLKRLAHRQLPRLDFHRSRAPEPWWPSAQPVRAGRRRA